MIIQLIKSTLVAIILFLLIAGCGARMYREGNIAFERGNYSEAIDKLQRAADEDPDNIDIWRQLGIAYYRTDQHERAVDALNQALLIDPHDPPSVLYLGLSHEVLGENEAALQTYRAYLSFAQEGQMTDRIRKRIRYLQDQEIQQEVRAIIAKEEEIDTEALPKTRVGVLGFDTEQINPTYAPLGRGLSEMLATDLSKVSGLTVVERIRLNEIRKELELGQSEMLDIQTAPRMGKLLGAGTVVTGKLSQPEEEQISAEAELVSTSQGVATYPPGVASDLQEFFRLEKELLYSILEELGYQPTAEERERLDSIPTTSLLAFLAYSRGLEYEDQGMYRLAEAEYQAALQEDPSFGAASAALSDVEGLSGYLGEVPPENEFRSEIDDMLDEQPTIQETGRSLKTTRSILGFQVNEADPDEGDNPHVYPPVKGKVTVTGSFVPDE